MSYNGWKLTDAARDELLRMFPPRYPEVFAHHVTHIFGGPASLVMPPCAVINIEYHADEGEGIEAFIVLVQTERNVRGTWMRPDRGTYHITWSLDRTKGIRPVDANSLIANNPWRRKINVLVDTIPFVEL